MSNLTLGRALVATAVLSSVAAAQIRSDGSPAAMTRSLQTTDVPIEFVQPPNVPDLMAEDEANGFRPFRYGALMPVDVGTDAQGVWDVLPDGTQVWRFKILSPGAHTIGLEFDDFVLPEGSSVFMYDDRLETVYGAYGSENNQPNEEILMEPFPGDSVIFEYLQPAGVEGTPELHLGTVIYDYRNVNAITNEQLANPGEVFLGSCLVDVNCADGDPWENQIDSVVRTLSNGGLCSGALINNTAEDGTGYVYTADHCGQTSNTVFRFNYQTSGCGSGGAPQTQNVSGCTVLATTGSFDSRLLRINNNIPSNYDPYYAGWTRATQNPNLAFSIGHPSGGPKKISIDGNGATKSSISGVANSAWFVDWSSGMLEGGSSGGPLFQQDGLVVGAACCVSNFNCVTQDAWYGRFDRFYTTQNAGQWLDPLGTNPTTLAGFDGENPGSGTFDPVIDSFEPSFITTVTDTSPFVVKINGSGFNNVTDVKVNGESLGGFPPQFTIPNDSTINMTLLPPFTLGQLSIEVIEGGVTAQDDLLVTVPTEPTINMVNSDPSFLITALGLQISMGSLPNDTHFLLVSTSNVPTSVPGLFDVDLGNNLASLFLIGTYVIDPALGYADVTIPLSGIATGTKIYAQSVVLSGLFPTFPLASSNLESGTVLF